MFIKTIARTSVAIFALAAGGIAAAAPVTLTFEGLKDRESVLGFYGGGAGSLGSTDTNYGITFGSDAFAQISLQAGGSGSFITRDPAVDKTVLSFTGTSAILNVSQGFSLSFGFLYSTANETGLIEVFEGLNGTGKSLGKLALTAQGRCATPGIDYCNWGDDFFGFSGVARSIKFTGTSDKIIYDSITFGDISVPTGGGVPEPASALLVAGALAALAGARRRAAKSA